MIKKYKYITLSKEERLALLTVMGEYQISHRIAGDEAIKETEDLSAIYITNILSNLLERSKHKPSNKTKDK